MLRQRFEEEVTPGEALLGPLHNYNSFADRFGCAVSAQQPFWRAPLDHGQLRVVLYGLTSPLISDEHDDDGANKLVLGAMQYSNFARERGCFQILLCHHPLDWIRDADRAGPYFDDRAHIQLFGHKHRHRLTRKNESVVLGAGAVHPERGDGWDPRYNVLVLERRAEQSTTTGAPTVTLRVYRRRWDPNAPSFGQDGAHEYHEFEMTLDDPEVRSATPAEGSQEAPPEVERSELAPGGGQEQASSTLSPGRALIYRLAMLPHLVQVLIGVDLGLLDDSDRKLRGPQLRERILARATENGSQEVLWAAVQSRYPSVASDPNPYLIREDE